MSLEGRVWMAWCAVCHIERLYRKPKIENQIAILRYFLQKPSSSNSEWMGSTGQEGGSWRNRLSITGASSGSFLRITVTPGLAMSEHEWVCVEISTLKVSVLRKSVIWKLKSRNDHPLYIRSSSNNSLDTFKMEHHPLCSPTRNTALMLSEGFLITLVSFPGGSSWGHHAAQLPTVMRSGFSWLSLLLCHGMAISSACGAQNGLEANSFLSLKSCLSVFCS